MLKNADRFHRVYTGLPIEERKLTIVFIEDEPINWRLAYEEINNQTERGNNILNILIDLKFI